MKPSIQRLPTLLLIVALAASPFAHAAAEEASSSDANLAAETETAVEEQVVSENSNAPTDSDAQIENPETATEDTAGTKTENAGDEASSSSATEDSGSASSSTGQEESGTLREASSSIASSGAASSTASSTNASLLGGGEDAAATSSEVSLASSTATTTAGIASTSEADANTASSTGGDTAIESGTAVALANILNLVNSNFVNSNGVVLFSNFFNTVFGAVDFRQYFASMFGNCSLTACSGENVVVNTSDTADIDNDVTLKASSGGNMIDSAGNAMISTGDAYAGLNLVNVANTNLIDSQYLLVTLNAFQDVNGDIVFPSLSQFFGTLAHGASTPSSIDIANSAAVGNDVNVSASAGGNSVSDADSSSITTGNAAASSNVFNQLNSSLVGGQSVSIIFRVQGSWAGEIFGAPDGLAWTVGDDGSIYLFDVGGAAANSTSAIHGTSTARINNKVNVVALTGDNAITNAHTAVISTGNAYAGANIINVANANVVGRNWILAVINIFGDFHGNIAFGRPDLWVGGQIDVPKKIQNGSELTYRYTIINNGDSPAHNASFTVSQSGNYLALTDSSQPYEKDGSSLQFDLGTLPPGGAKEVTFSAKIEGTQEGTEIVSTGSATQHETDNNTADNTEVLSLRTDRHHTGNGVHIELGGGGTQVKNRAATGELTAAATSSAIVPLTISRTTGNATVSTASPNAKEEIILQNNTKDVAHGVILHDLLRDPSGTVIRDETWDLGDVQPGEEIDLSYVITFSPAAPRGTYTLSSTAQGSNVDVTSGQNGTIIYEEVGTLLSPLLSALGLSSAPAGATVARHSMHASSSAPLVTKETPLLSAPIAHAAESNGQLAAASAAGTPIHPLVLFFGLVAIIGAFFTFRLLRVF
jgi:hypothetical protein